ncbi:MAG: 4Fe-4S binding protein [Tissierellia bacterium]|jgi:Pyruvate/2-oxoacid:ferredoxin oxidoreductase delta subunit|nr:4Fe-4S binding protein [Tissierellia bacterium]
MTKRQVIEIDQDLCIGCGLCTKACHQGAIQLVDGKAKLMSDSYCDGLGMCLPNCPVDAIKLIEKETSAFDESRKDFALKQTTRTSCAGSQPKTLASLSVKPKPQTTQPINSELRQWPVQLHLVNPNAPYLQGANLLIAADCTSYAYGDFHHKFMRGKVTIIGCPKLDDTSAYREKLTQIFMQNDIASVTVVRMSVPCCGGMTRVVQDAIKQSGAIVPYAEVTISAEGEIL